MKSSYRILTMLAALAAGIPLVAQTIKEDPLTPTEDAAKTEAVQLPAFTIKAETDTGYVGKSALGSTRIAVDIADLPQSVKVLNSSFVKAVNPFNLADVLNYTGGAQSGAINWTPGRLAIRGFSGDGIRVTASPDSHLSNIHLGTVVGNGYDINGGNVKLTNCKAFS